MMRWCYKEEILKVSTTMAQKLVITDVPRLDTVTVFLEDLGPREGKVTIGCYDKSWSAWWGGIGDRPVREFFLSCDEHYLAGNFGRGRQLNHTIYDLEGLAAHARKKVITERRAGDLDKEQARELFDDTGQLEGIERVETLHDLKYRTMQEIFGDEWWYSLPMIPNPEYEYLCRIITTAQEALRQAA